MPTPPAVPPAKPTTASTPPPAIKSPKLNFATRNALNNAVEDVQDFLKANDTALRGQASTLIDKAIGWVESVVKPAVDKAITWVGAKVNALKF